MNTVHGKMIDAFFTVMLRNAIILAVLLAVQPAPLCAQKPDRSKPPELGPPPSMKLPQVQHFKLSNGLQVVFMEKHEVPLAQLELVVKAGSAMDPEGQSGLASMALALMEEGAGSRNALELADAIDFLGANISTFAGQHTSNVFLHTPLSKLDSALAIFSDISLRPTFPAEELERKRKERLTTLVQWHDEPRSIATVLFNRTVFGTQHPYGIPGIGNEQSIRSFRADDLKSYHQTYFHPNNAVLIVVGDLTKDLLLPKLESAFRDWSPAIIPATSWVAVGQVKQRQILVVDKPAAAQSEIRIGCVGAPRLTDDYYAIQVMNTILGGSFTSRLNRNLREQHGYAYGAGSSFDVRPLPGPFIARAAVQTAVTDKALTEFIKELNGILQPVTEEELERAKNYLTLRYPENFGSVAQIAAQLSDLAFYNLPDDYFNNYVRNIIAVTRDDVQRVAKKYLNPEKMAIVIVGDRQQIEQGIAGLNLAAPRVLSIDDVLGKTPSMDK